MISFLGRFGVLFASVGKKEQGLIFELCSFAAALQGLLCKLLAKARRDCYGQEFIRLV